MKKSIYMMAMATIVAMSLIACRVETTQDLGKQQTKTVAVEPFAAIVGNGSADIHLSVADKYEVKVTGPEKILKGVSVKVDDGILTIDDSGEDDDNVIYRGANVGRLEVWVSAPIIVAVTTTGSGSIDAEGSLTLPQLTLTSTGSGDITVDSLQCEGALQVSTLGSGDVTLGDNINAGQATISTSGSGNVDFARLTASKVNLKTSGSGDIVGPFLKADDVTLVTNGSADINIVAGHCGSIKGDSYGSGDIVVQGTARSCTLNRHGSGKVVSTVNGK